MLHTYDELETGRESCFFQAPRSPDAVSVACVRTRVNSVLVLRPVDCGSMFAGKWDHQSERAEGRWNTSRRSKKQTVYSTCWESATFSLRGICLFSPLKSSVVIESNTNRIICSMENTKIKARRACKLFFTKKTGERKRSWSVRRSPIHSLCFSHGYEPTPRLFRTRIALLCENDVALASLMDNKSECAPGEIRLSKGPSRAQIAEQTSGRSISRWNFISAQGSAL